MRLLMTDANVAQRFNTLGSSTDYKKLADLYKEAGLPPPPVPAPAHQACGRFLLIFLA
jgi:hypothetical protein